MIPRIETGEKYNESLVRRGKTMLSFDSMKQWNKELKGMNHEKEEGRKYVYSESFIKALGTAICICHSDKQKV